MLECGLCAFVSFLPAVGSEGQTSPSSCPSQLFPGRQFATDQREHRVITADFNRDGLDDLATQAYDTVYVRLALGDGTFESQQALSTGFQPNGLAAPDLNGDGAPDLAVANGGGLNGIPLTGGDSIGSVSILLNRGDGTFMPPSTYAAGKVSADVASDDFDGDGDNDIVVSNRASANFSLFLNNGNGTLVATANVPCGATPSEIALGDVDGDADIDVAISNSGAGTVAMCRNDGFGHFQAPTFLQIGGGLQDIGLADFNGDGDVDLAVCSQSLQQVLVYLGDGSGSFSKPTSFAASSPACLAIADLDGDQDRDLAIVVYDCVAAGDDHCVLALYNDSSGNFQESAHLVTGSEPSHLATGDFDGDRHVDVVVSCYYLVTVINGGANGRFLACTSVASPYGPSDCALGDLDEDNDREIVVTNNYWNHVSLFHCSGYHSYSHIADIVGFPGGATEMHDMDDDGDLDIVGGFNGAIHDVAILRNTGGGLLALPDYYEIPGKGSGLGAVDIDNDGDTDIAVAGRDVDLVGVFKNSGSGLLNGPLLYPTGDGPLSVEMVDFNNDGLADLVTANSAGTVSVLLNLGGGILAQAADYSLGGAGYSTVGLAVGDLNHDRMPDIAVGIYSVGPTTRVDVLLNQGNATFGPVTHYAAGEGVSSVDIGDLDRDGHPDIAVGNTISDNISVLLGAGDGTFRAAMHFAAAGGVNSVHLIDADQDGDLDIVAADHHGVSILFNNHTCSSLDFNGDGQVNVGDLLYLIAHWGPCPAPPAECPFDLTGDHQVNIADLLVLITQWHD